MVPKNIPKPIQHKMPAVNVAYGIRFVNATELTAKTKDLFKYLQHSNNVCKTYQLKL